MIIYVYHIYTHSTWLNSTWLFHLPETPFVLLAHGPASFGQIRFERLQEVAMVLQLSWQETKSHTQFVARNVLDPKGSTHKNKRF